MSKRKRPVSTGPSQDLSEHEKTVYDLIRSKRDMGIRSVDLRRDTKLFPNPNVVDKALKALLAKNLIKQVKTVQYRGSKHYMATEFEPSAEVTGGAWYNEGVLDTAFIDLLKERCLIHISSLKVATVDMISDAIKRSKIFHAECSSQQIGEILRTLVLDNEILEVKSTGLGEFTCIPIGRVCFKLARKPGSAKEPKAYAMASIPCGVCPRIEYCSPDGIIKPSTCEYYNKFLDF
ncbi:DNA-directed RNA polymerase III subunit RPC6 [Punica granatum]|nr:DNA-directed RNA polymerase III subunit RPC6 [Punica granatum]